MNRIENKVLGLVLSRMLDKNMRILELTPGEGSLAKALVQHGYANVEAMDIHPENFRVEGIKCHKGNLNNPFPFERDSFDLVITVEGIEHLENQYQFASEINRILKKNGFLILTTPNIINFASRIRFLLTGFYALAVRPSSEFKKDWTIEHIYPLTFWQLRHILHTSGLFIMQIETDHIRKSALPGILIYPIGYFFTWKSLMKEGEHQQREKNKEILKQIHQPELFYGRTQIILAQKRDSTYAKGE